MTENAALSEAPEDLSTSESLKRLAATAAAEGETVTLKWILDQLNERAFGLFLLVLALPCCIPFLYGVPQVVAVPMLLVSVQLVAGRRSPWLPEGLAAREIKSARLAQLAERAGPWLEYFEALSRPRLGFLTRPPLDRVVGLFLVLFCASILVPLPSTNTAPGIAVALVALGFLERDGLLTLGGVILGTVWIVGLIVIAAGLLVWAFG